jgi:hypothetical protein
MAAGGLVAEMLLQFLHRLIDKEGQGPAGVPSTFLGNSID